MTVHVLSAGDGYSYYTNEVATGDVRRESGRELGDYYTADGNPPGVWVGSGRALLGVDGAVSEQQMKALYGEGLHPNAERIIRDQLAAGASPEAAHAAAKLGRGYYSYRGKEAGLGDAIRTGYDDFTRINHREPDAEERRKIRVREGAQAFRQAKGRSPVDKEELGRFITAASRPDQQAVAGFDLVFSPAKSVSVLWALGDEDTRRAIEGAHEKAIDATIGYLEREAIATRAGTNGVAQIDVEGGLIATRFRHYDSRNGDPQLHDHVVVANKVMGSDGKWRTIDSKLLHRQGVAASEFYNQAVMGEIQTRLGVTTEARTVTAGKRAVIEIAGVDERLLGQFSTRSADIRKATRDLEKEYRKTHGRAPDAVARIALAQQATLDTRPQKLHARSLSELRLAWRGQAVENVGERTVEQLLERARSQRSGQGSAGPIVVADAAREVVAIVSEHHAVWGPHMIEAEARRWVQAHQVGRSVGDEPAGEGIVETITRHALATDSIAVTPPAPHDAFAPLTRQDGSSIYDHKGRMLFTSGQVLRAEDTLLEAGRRRTIGPVSLEQFEAAVLEHGRELGAGQVALARDFVTGDRHLVVGIGPAGAGKTTALRLAARATEQAGGRMIGLAPSGAAAIALKEGAGIPAHTIHSFLAGHSATLPDGTVRRSIPEGMQIRAGDIIVVDEAGMAGTLRLAQVVDLAEHHGAHVRLIGDDRQLGAVETGGALRLLATELGAVQLEDLHRFTDPAEAAATLDLRDPARSADPFTWYMAEGRVTAGSEQLMVDQVFAGWQHDLHDGREALMLAQTNTAVLELNTRAQAYRMIDGTVTGRRTVPLRGGLAAHRGDTIVTRSNHSLLRYGLNNERVANGDLWTVTRTHRDGSLTVAHHRNGGTITLPADYVAKHVELGYASTLHRAQGMTVDASHVLATSSTSRELAYVGLSRGRERNQLYVHTEDGQYMADVLEQIAANSDGMLSATETIRAEQARVDDLVTLVDQYSDVDARATDLRFAAIVADELGVDAAEALTAAESWGAVTAALEHAEQAGVDPGRILTTSWEERETDSAADRGAVLSTRIENRLEVIGADSADRSSREDDVAVPAWLASRAALDDEHTPIEWRVHLQERYNYLAGRLEERGAALEANQPAWAAQLGPVPAEAAQRDKWTQLAAEVDVYRARYKIPASEVVAIPEAHLRSPVGQRLATRVEELRGTGAPAEASTSTTMSAAADRARKIALARQMSKPSRASLRAAGIDVDRQRDAGGPENSPKPRQPDIGRDTGRER